MSPQSLFEPVFLRGPSIAESTGTLASEEGARQMLAFTISYHFSRIPAFVMKWQ